MARAPTNKSALHRQQKALERYRRFLPSLDMKRRQLMAERRAARAALAATEAEFAALRAGIGESLPMLAREDVVLDGLARVTEVRVGEENAVGITLPVFQGVETGVAHYSTMAMPHWVDGVARRLAEAAALWHRARVERERLQLLEAAVRKVTQRVNLFDKVLIPRAEVEIRRIRIALSDTERAAVVRAKVAKAKEQRHLAEAGT